jgi:acyl carrier protein
MSGTTLDQLQDLFRKILGLPALVIKPADTANDVVGWDSLNHMRLIAEVESHFGVQFSFEDVRGLQNVGDLIRLIDTKRIS